MIVGIIARTSRRPSYGDARLDRGLPLDTSLRSSGRITIVKTIDDDGNQTPAGLFLLETAVAKGRYENNLLRTPGMWYD